MPGTLPLIAVATDVMARRSHCQTGRVASAHPMSRDLPRAISEPAEPALTRPKRMSSAPGSRHLSVLSGAKTGQSARLTRGQVAARLDISVSTVRRYEGNRLHPTVDEHDVRWFDENEVAALAAEMVNKAPAKQTGRTPTSAARATEQRSVGELAALVFERLEQRQSLAEIVIGLRVEPDTVRALFEQWCLGLTEGQLRMAREPRLPRRDEIPRARPVTLAERLAELPSGTVTRISVGRSRGDFQHGDLEFIEIVELGGFHVSGPCTIDEVTRRFGPGDYRVTAYGFEPPGLRWELLVGDLA